MAGLSAEASSGKGLEHFRELGDIEGIDLHGNCVHITWQQVSQLRTSKRSQLKRWVFFCLESSAALKRWQLRNSSDGKFTPKLSATNFTKLNVILGHFSN